MLKDLIKHKVFSEYWLLDLYTHYLIQIMLSGKLEMAYKVEGDAKTIGKYEYLDLKVFNFRFIADGIESAEITNNDVVRGSPTLSK